MKLRVAHVSATFPPYRGGTGNVCLHNARELVRRGHDVAVVTAAYGGAPTLEMLDGVKVQRLRPLVRVGNAPLLPGLIRALRGYDVIHLHYPFFGGEITALAAWLHRAPLVVTYHQDVFLSGIMGVIATAMRHTVGRAALRGAARVLFTSLDYGRASYVAPMLRDRAQIVGALPNGVDTQRFDPRPPLHDIRTQHNLCADDRVVLLVAGLDHAHAFKGVSVLLRALVALPPHVKALVVGDGELRADYARTAERLGVGNRVVFAGRVSDALLPDYYRAADVAVLPSVTMGEAFGLVLLEALACGTPVVASNLPGVRTVIEQGKDGLLVAPNDPHALAAALRRITEDAPLRRAMGWHGRARVEATYAWEQIGARLEAIYAEIIGERSPALAVAQGDV